MKNSKCCSQQATAIDAVCGMRVQIEGARYVVVTNDDEKHYFCNASCMQRFAEGLIDAGKSDSHVASDSSTNTAVLGDKGCCSARSKTANVRSEGI